MTPTHIIIHCSATADSGTVSWPAIRRYHVDDRGWSDIGYHGGIELINNQFEFLLGRPFNRRGAHCAAGGMNRRSLGICFVGDFENQAPAPESLVLGAKHVAGLCAIFNIPPENVIGHRRFDVRKTCPGSAFDMEEFRVLVGQSVGK